MNDFKKGLLVGIVIMSSIFLFIASTSPKMGSNDRREIVEYKMIRIHNFPAGAVGFSEEINNHIDGDWQPFGSPMMGDKYCQAMVKYKED